MRRPPLIPAVSIALHDKGRFLLVLRENPPDSGLWAFPGGKCEPGESGEDAARRELFEETGLNAGALAEIAVFEVPAKKDGKPVLYRLAVFSASDWSGRAAAASDAADLRWAGPEDGLALVPGVAAVMAQIIAGQKTGAD